MNIKVVNQQKDIVRVIINDPKTYNSLSFKNLNDLIKVFKTLDNNKILGCIAIFIGVLIVQLIPIMRKSK